MNPESNKPALRSRWGRFSPSMGWRAFWSEIVIVVLGVMIALAANEAVQTWNWQAKVREGELRLRADMEENFFYAAEILVSQPCIKAQLADITRHLMASGPTLDPLPLFSEKDGVDYVIRVPTRLFTSTVWESLIADGTALHIPEDRRRTYSEIEGSQEALRSQNVEIKHLASRVSAMSFPMELDAGVRRELLVELQAMRATGEFNAVSARQMMAKMVALKMAPIAGKVDAELEEWSGTLKFCKMQKLPLADWRDGVN